MIKLLFLFSIAITVALTVMQMLGTDLMNLIIVMIIVDFLSLAALTEMEHRKTVLESKDFIVSKVEGVEKVCNDIFARVSSNPGVESMLEKQKNDINYVLDKVSKKSLELEERLNLFGKVLSNNLIEKKEEKESIEKKAEQESYSVGEIVYIEDEENK